jgi:hypothetical protein
MKKITAVVLALGLTMPAHSWTLFPVREKVVIETKTDYTATIVVGVVALIASLAAGKLIFSPKELSDEDKAAESIRIVSEFIGRINPSLRNRYNVTLVIDEYGPGREECRLVHISNKDFMDYQEDVFIGIVNNLVRQFNYVFGAFGLSLKAAQQLGAFEICLGSERRRITQRVLTGQNVQLIMDFIERTFFPPTDSEQEGME